MLLNMRPTNEAIAMIHRYDINLGLCPKGRDVSTHLNVCCAFNQLLVQSSSNNFKYMIPTAC